MVFLTDGLLGEGPWPTLPAAVGVPEAGEANRSTVASSAWPKESDEAPDAARECLSMVVSEEMVVPALSSRPPVPSLLVLTPSDDDVVPTLDSESDVLLSLRVLGPS
jgi:hypothetical protein